MLSGPAFAHLDNFQVYLPPPTNNKYQVTLSINARTDGKKSPICFVFDGIWTQDLTVLNPLHWPLDNTLVHPKVTFYVVYMTQKEVQVRDTTRQYIQNHELRNILFNPTQTWWIYSLGRK